MTREEFERSTTDSLRRLETAMFGDGSEENVGVMMKLDRLSQDKLRWDRAVSTITNTALGVCVTGALGGLVWLIGLYVKGH